MPGTYDLSVADICSIAEEKINAIIFDQKNSDAALAIFKQIRQWIRISNLKLVSATDSALRYSIKLFQISLCGGLAAGTNNVIKAMKRKAFGYRNIEYFRLKILQVCGFLNSRHMLDTGLPTKRYIELAGYNISLSFKCLALK
jgi:hypothetical protein